MIFPGSPLAKKPPRWVMAAELVETSRLFARTVARIEPEWIEPLAGHLVKRTYSEPHWSRKRAAAVATERVTLYGIPIVVGRTVDFGRIDPELARELFIRHALVEGDWDTRHRFFHANRELLEDVEELEHRARRRDLVVDEETLVAFYDERIPPHVVSGRHFDSWWKKESRRQPDLLDFTEEMLRTARAAEVRPHRLPGPRRGGRAHAAAVVRVRAGRAHRRRHRRRAGRRAAPGRPHAVHLAGARAARGAGHRPDPHAAQAAAPAVRPRARPRPGRARSRLHGRPRTGEPLLDGLERELGRMRGVDIPREAWELDRLPEHLTVTFRVVDEAGREVATGTDLEALRRQLAPKVRAELAAAGVEIERTGRHHLVVRHAAARAPVRTAGHTSSPATPGWSTAARPWTCGSSRPRPSATRPTCAASGGCCCWRPRHRSGRCSANWTTPRGSRCPATRTVRSPRCSTTASRPPPTPDRRGRRPAVGRAGLRPAAQLFRDRLASTTLQVLQAVRGVLVVWHRAQAQLADLRAPVLAAGVTDITAQVDALVGPGFATAAGATRLADVARYLEAVERRIEKLRADPARDAEWTAQVPRGGRRVRRRAGRAPAGRRAAPALREIRWMIEELRVSLYAHPMRTRYPVSIKRIQKAIDELPR